MPWTCFAGFLKMSTTFAILFGSFWVAYPTKSLILSVSLAAALTSPVQRVECDPEVEELHVRVVLGPAHPVEPGQLPQKRGLW